MFYFLPISRGRLQVTYQTAMRILDKVRDGVHFPQSVILKALELTGDIDEHGSL
jgi:hypothetical protein